MDQTSAFLIASKSTKSLVNLTKQMHDLYTKNYKTSLKESLSSLSQPVFMAQERHTVKIEILCHLITDLCNPY